MADNEVQNNRDDVDATSAENTSDKQSFGGKMRDALAKAKDVGQKVKEHNYRGDFDKATAEAKKIAGAIKQRDLRADLHDGVAQAKDIAGKLKEHDFRAEIHEAVAEAKKDPASIWRKPESPHPGKELAIAGLAVALVLFLVTAITSSSFIGFLCFILAIGSILFSLLGLKTEGRKIAIGGVALGLLVVLCSLGQLFGGGGSHSGGKGGKFALLEANEGKEASSASAVIDKAENAKNINSLNFYGFYTGMSFKDAKLLSKHYGLNEDHVWFYYNKENGEVYKMWFTPKAITSIMDVANNFDTVELALQEYLGIVSWNNEKEVIEGEVDSLFQDEGDKFWFGDKADVARWYKTADGVSVKLYPNQKAWNSGKGVLQIYDSARGKKAMAFNLPFENNQKMREELAALKKNGVKTLMLQLPRGFEWLMREFNGSWIGAFPMTEEQRMFIFHGLENTARNRAAQSFERGKLAKEGITLIIKDFNDLSADARQGLLFRLPFPEEKEKIEDAGKSKTNGSYIIGEGEEAAKKSASRLSQTEINNLEREARDAWLRYSGEAAHLRAIGKSEDEIIAEGVGDTEGKFREGFYLQRGIVREGEKYVRIEKDEQDKRFSEFVKRTNEAKAAAKARIEEKAKQEAAQKAAEEKARRDKAELDKAREEKRAVEKLVQPQGSNNQGKMSPTQLMASIPGVQAEKGNLLERGQSRLKEMDAELSNIEKEIAQKEAEIAKLRADAKAAKDKVEAFHANGQINEENEQDSIATELKLKVERIELDFRGYLNALHTPLTFNSADIKSYRSEANGFAAELEKREKTDRETARQLQGKAPEDAIKDWLSAADMLKNARPHYLDLAEKCAKMIDRVNAILSKGQ